MKKTFLLIFFVLFTLISCQQDVIFYDIAQEIELDDPTISGKVVSMDKANQVLYAANGQLNKKGFEGKRWSKVSGSPKSVEVVVYADSYLYVGSLVSSEEKTSLTIFAHELESDGSLKSSSDWKEIDTGVSYLFSNKSTENPVVYYTKGTEVFKLSGAESSNLQTVNLLTGETAKACVRIGDKDIFLENANCTAKNGYIFVANGKNLKSATLPVSEETEITWKEGESANSEITSMFLDGSNLYVGTKSGVQVTTLGEDGTYTTFSNLQNNAETSFGDREILGLWKYDNADNFFVSVTAGQTSIYDALWGYNSSSQKWNLE